MVFRLFPRFGSFCLCFSFFPPVFDIFAHVFSISLLFLVFLLVFSLLFTGVATWGDSIRTN